MSLLDVLLDWINWFHFLFLEDDQHVVLIDCMIFLSPFLEVTRMSISSFFPCTARLWNSLPIKCFPLAYNVNGLKSRIKSFNCRFFLKRLPVCVNLFVLLFLAIPYRIVAVQPCMEWIPIKKKIKLITFVEYCFKVCTSDFNNKLKDIRLRDSLLNNYCIIASSMYSKTRLCNALWFKDRNIQLNVLLLLSQNFCVKFRINARMVNMWGTWM